MKRCMTLISGVLGEQALAHAPDGDASLAYTVWHLLFGSHHLPLLLATVVALVGLRYLVTRRRSPRPAKKAFRRKRSG